MLQFGLGLSVVVWLDQGFDPSWDPRHSYSRGFRSFQGSGRLSSLALLRLHPCSRWVVRRFGRILWRNVPWLCSCSMVLSDVGVVRGFVSVGVGLVCGTPPLW